MGDQQNPFEIDSYELMPVYQITSYCQGAPGFRLQTLSSSHNQQYLTSEGKQGWMSCKNPTYPVSLVFNLRVPAPIEVICLSFMEGRVP